MENTREIIKKRIKDCFEVSGLKQNFVASKIGVSTTTIQRWLKGEVVPSVENLDSLANVFGVSVASFFMTDKPTIAKAPEPTPAQALAILQNAIGSKESDLDIIKEAGVEWQYGIVMDEARKIVAQKRAEKKKKSS